MVADTGNEEPTPDEESAGPHGGLTPNQERAIIALLNEQATLPGHEPTAIPA